jgi:hypothetical protein
LCLKSSTWIDDGSDVLALSLLSLTMNLVAVYGICIESCGSVGSRLQVGHGLQVNGFETRVHIDQITGLGVARMSLQRPKKS